MKLLKFLNVVVTLALFFALGWTFAQTGEEQATDDNNNIGNFINDVSDKLKHSLNEVKLIPKEPFDLGKNSKNVDFLHVLLLAEDPEQTFSEFSNFKALLSINANEEVVEIKPIKNEVAPVFASSGDDSDTSVEASLKQAGEELDVPLDYFLKIDMEKISSIVEEIDDPSLQSNIEKLKNSRNLTDHSMKSVENIADTIQSSMSIPMMTKLQSSMETNMEFSQMMKVVMKLMNMKDSLQVTIDWEEGEEEVQSDEIDDVEYHISEYRGKIENHHDEPIQPMVQ
ncbi:hypothetical protein [Ornithinibacillus halophilus]|uniref:Uncharacterized protein n=1 Tax=Ornithinibacillus halophilus TaxID=930117 RepID=A0A1M5J6M1_9BACI|nr:hypothetical protein [Ornithinibacillus halophilus]SHG36266.1 hypothetical protein SAMN05216225_102833 [Ornithinibacillus halophilus]